MKRRIGVLLMVLVLSLGISTPTLAVGQVFSDVPATHWSYDYVHQAYEDGVVNGVGSGRFAPDSTLTIAQFMAMMTRAFYPEEVAIVEDAVEDAGDWYLPGLKVALEYNLLINTYVDPETWNGYMDPCSRYEMAAIMYNIIQAYELEDFILDGRTAAAIGARIPDFSSIPNEFRISVAALVNAGVIAGVDSAGTFAGDHTVTRAQAAAIYCRFAQLMEQQETQPGDTVQPEQPVQPSEPTQPEQPVQPSEPTQPEQPAQPSEPTQPEEPAQPSEPTQPEQPAQPSEPTQPEEPAQPSEPTQPEEPAQPSEPTQPEEPVQPSEPTQPTEPVQPSEPVQPEDDLQAIREEMLAQINDQRAQAGLSALTLSDAAGDAAQLRAKELITLFSHDRPNGQSCFTALKEEGISYRAAGENIAAGQRSVTQVMTSWMNSEGHRANILNGNFTQVGIGFVKSDSGYGYYWVQMFIG